jgi:hypothetical protein
VISKKTARNFQSTTFSQHWKSHFNVQSFKRKSITDKTLPKPEYTASHKTRWAQTAKHEDHNNTKTIWKIIVLCSALCFKLRYKKSAKNSFSIIVIPSKTAKKLLIYYLQPTLEIAFQTYSNLHAGSTWQAERTPKNTSKKPHHTLKRAKHTRHAEAARNPKTKTRRARTKVNSLTNPAESQQDPSMTKAFSSVDQLGLVSEHVIPSQDGRNVNEETLKHCSGTGFSLREAREPPEPLSQGRSSIRCCHALSLRREV